MHGPILSDQRDLTIRGISQEYAWHCKQVGGPPTGWADQAAITASDDYHQAVDLAKA